MTDFILYGAYGYTGKLITNLAAEYGLTPLLAGRNEAKLSELSIASGFPYRVVDLNNQTALRDLLKTAKVVLHAAGPFIETAELMMDACLSTGTHYLDITGEIAVFQLGAARDIAGHHTNVMIMPGVGFDVVPTDCLAAYLKEQLLDATHLKLAFAWSGGGVSQGTAKTMLLGMGHPGAVRKNGKIIPVKAAFKTEEFPFTADRKLRAVTIPWGDVFTAFHTTKIPNIETYFAAPLSQQRLMGWSNYLGPLLRMSFVKDYLNKQVESRPPGPDEQQRQAGRAYVYGEVTNADGATKAARLETIEGYTLTARTALMITRRVLNGEWEKGYRTPAGVYGANFILEVDGTKREDV